MYGRFEEDEDRPQPSASGAYKIPDRDFHRKNWNVFSSVFNHFDHRLSIRSFKDRRWDPPHFSSLVNVRTPYSNILNPADGICCHFLRRGFTKPNKILFNCAVWSADSRWLVLGTQAGDLALWEAEALKVHKIISIPAHKEFYGDSDHIKAEIPITAVAWKHYGNLVVTGDNKGVIQYCDETFRNVFVAKDAHIQAVRGLSFSPLDSKLVSCSDDGKIQIWPSGTDRPEKVLTGHQSDIKSVDWHPFRSLLASGSRDTTVKLWDPRSGNCLR
jgi:polyadenylation factor subunit 2